MPYWSGLCQSPSPLPFSSLTHTATDSKQNFPSSHGAESRRSRRNRCASNTALSTAWLILLLLLDPCRVLASSMELTLGTASGVHDFGRGLPNRSGEIASADPQSTACRFCHMPGNLDPVTYGDAGILWNEAASTRSDWQMYGSNPGMLEWIDGRAEPAPTGSSKVCLSCHDGVTAANQSDGRTAGSNAAPLADDPGYRSTVGVGGTAAGLTNNHPISISYAWSSDSQLHDPAYAVMGDGRSVQALLEDGRVECATCHDVHTNEVIGNASLLRLPTSGANISGSGASDLCLVCHDK